MKPTLTGPLKATAATIAIVLSFIFNNMVSAEQNSSVTAKPTIASASPIVDF